LQAAQEKEELEGLLAKAEAARAAAEARAAELEGQLQEEVALRKADQAKAELAKFQAETVSGCWADADKKVNAGHDSTSLSPGQLKALGQARVKGSGAGVLPVMCPA